MTVLHSGTTKQYSDNWGQAFGAAAKRSTKASKKGSAKAPPKKKKAPARKPGK